MVSYKVSVVTADLPGSGTDANVFITIFGENGTSSERKLDSSENNFERGHTDVFQLQCVDLGELKR